MTPVSPTYLFYEGDFTHDWMVLNLPSRQWSELCGRIWQVATNAMKLVPLLEMSHDSIRFLRLQNILIHEPTDGDFCVCGSVAPSAALTNTIILGQSDCLRQTLVTGCQQVEASLACSRDMWTHAISVKEPALV